jgi:HAD superfamily hydrolase (TIGR01549 family)
MYNALKKNFTETDVDLKELMYKWGYKTHKLYTEHRQKNFINIIEIHILGLKDALDDYDIKISNELSYEIVNDVWNCFIKNNRLYPNTIEVLDKLKINGYKLGLITDSEFFIVNGILQKHNLDDFFDIKVISGIVKLYKPNSQLFKIAIDLSKCSPCEAIYIGDSEVDIKGAKNVGMITVIVNRNEIPDIEIGIQPNYRINSLKELPDLISKIKK